MSIFSVKPNFNAITRQVAFPTDELNYFMREELQETFGFYQSTFGLYNYLQLNKSLKYVIHSPYGSPLLWQPHNSCAWDDTGSLRIGRKEIVPCRAKLNESYCYDEKFDSAFEHFLSWDGRGPLRLDANGVDAVNQLIQVLLENATLGARLTLTAGQLYDHTQVEFNDQTSADIRDLFKRTVGTCKGWIELVREMGLQTKYSHMNVEGIFSDSDFVNAKKFIGDPILVYDNLRASARPDLDALLNEGGVAGSIEGDFMPLFLVTTSIFNAIAEQYRKQCVQVTCVNPRLTRREFTYNTSRGPRPLHVYYIDDTPVIPISDTQQFDKYLTGATHGAWITPSRNIGLGASFGSLPQLAGGSSTVGMRIELRTDLANYGRYDFLSHSLFTATIADTEFFVGSQIYTEPA